MNRQDVHQPLTDTKLLLDSATSVSQTFVSSYANLNIVSVCLRNPARLLSPLTFNLYEGDSSTPIRKIDFSGGNVSEDDCTRLQFEPIADSFDQSYTFELTSAGFADPVNLKNSMYLEVAHDSNYPDGTGYVDGDPIGMDTHFKTFYRQEIGEVFRESISQFVNRLPLDLGFILPYILLVAFVIYRLVRR